MEEILREVGLTSNECKVYIAMLKLKSALAGQLAEISGVHRRNVYDALERLIQKGLVSYVSGKKKKYFKAEPPSNLLKLLDAKKEIIQDGMPKLNSIFNEKLLDVNVRVYFGPQGMKNILEGHLASKTDILVYGKSVMDLPDLKFYFPQYKRRRVARRIKVQAIFDSSMRKKEPKVPYAKIKYLPDNFMGQVSTSVYDNKVAIMLVLDTPTVILIESKKLYEAYKGYFELLWKIAK
jgi:sugar-specific transcriptional regulator TrmB